MQAAASDTRRMAQDDCRILPVELCATVAVRLQRSCPARETVGLAERIEETERIEAVLTARRYVARSTDSEVGLRCVRSVRSPAAHGRRRAAQRSTGSRTRSRPWPGSRRSRHGTTASARAMRCPVGRRPRKRVSGAAATMCRLSQASRRSTSRPSNSAAGRRPRNRARRWAAAGRRRQWPDRDPPRRGRPRHRPARPAARLCRAGCRGQGRSHRWQGKHCAPLAIVSMPLSTERVLDAVRAHRYVENRLHGVLDVFVDEPRTRARTDHGPAYLARPSTSPDSAASQSRSAAPTRTKAPLEASSTARIEGCVRRRATCRRPRRWLCRNADRPCQTAGHRLHARRRRTRAGVAQG